MLKAMIKFCGGCNPRYDRGQAFAEIRDHFAGRIEFVTPEMGQHYELLLIVTGCGACQIFDEQARTNHWISVDFEHQIPDKLEELEKLLKEYES